MKRLHRRNLLASLGVLGSSAWIAGCGGTASSGVATSGQSATSAPSSIPRSSPPDEAVREPPQVAETHARAVADWSYVRLDPRAVAERAYQIYPRGACMYSVFGSVITELGEQVGEPFRSFPLQMMRYGASGLGGWGSVCGMLNGAAALIGLFYPNHKDRDREELLTELCLWYETACLPVYEPEDCRDIGSIEPSKAGSVLCHVSVKQWCRVNECEAFHPRRSERCRRLSTDGAIKVVEMLNRDCPSAGDFLDISEETHGCLECHGRGNLQNAMGRMSCIGCHEMGKSHP